MTIDEAIKHCEEKAEELENEAEDIEYGDLNWKYEWKKCKQCAEEHRQLVEWLRELKQLREQTRWIPVSERLPGLGEVVLTYDKAFGYLTAIYSEVVDDYDERIPCFSTHYSISSDKWAIMHPIAWMPLPEPYKAESEE